MEIERSSCAPGRFFLLVLVSILGVSNSEKWSTYHSATLNRSSFPAGFVFGAASSSYQSEGAAFEDGRSPSSWDTFTHQFPDKIKDHSTGDVADDFYHRYKEDIILMKNIGLDAFRFSISWSRILPKGKISGGVNPLAIEFYNNLINDLLSNGLQPYVALFHWDLPQALEDDYGGLLSLEILSDYLDYADFCFATFGDRVKHWFTFNEPYEYTKLGYATGIYAPGRCSDYIGNCTSGNSATEPYIVGHHIILCHAAALKLYKEKYQAFQKGQIGIILSSWWIMPFSENTVSRKAAQRALDFQLGWFLHPLIYGDYPLIMRTLVGNRLPKFTTSESRMVKMSYDVLGINYYTARYAADDVFFNVFNLSMTTDDRVGLSAVKNGVPIGRQTILSWLYIYPKGIRELLLYIKDKYGNPPMFITENGVADEESIEDEMRIMFHYEHLTYLLKAIKEGADVRGYFIWSFLDDFEWVQGFTARFGITYVDYKNGLKRYPKDSAIWYNKFLQGKNALSRSSTSQWHSEVKERESSSIFRIHETFTDSYFL